MERLMFILTDKNKNEPVCAKSPHFRWSEILQNEGMVKGYEHKNFNCIDDVEIMYNAVIGAMMLEDYRKRLGRPINGQSGHRPELYNDVVMIENGYKASKTSDHKYINSFAFDSDVPATTQNVDLWKSVCDDWGVNWSIGRYSWGLHLGYRRNQPARMWDNR
jgi:hypothetical protein